MQDTVGFAHSFLSALLSKISEKEKPEKSLEFTLVAAQKDANETETPQEIENLKKTEK